MMALSETLAHTAHQLMSGNTFREISNGTWFLLNLSVLAVLLRYLYYRSRRRGTWFYLWRYATNTDWEADEWGGSAAFAFTLSLSIYFTGSAIRGGWVWYRLWTENLSGLPVTQASEDPTYILLSGVVIGTIGSLCCVRVISKEKWGHRVWVTFGALSLTLPLAAHILPRL